MRIDNVTDPVVRGAETVGGELRDLAWLLRTAVIGLVIGAVYTELRKPPQQRTWNGRLLGVVPYDFRMPTLDNLRKAYWNPRSQVIFTDRPLGVGWAVNVPALLRRVGVNGTRRRRTAARGGAR
jgi:hypothetical protein